MSKRADKVALSPREVNGQVQSYPGVTHASDSEQESKLLTNVSKRGKLVVFFRNGDPHHKGLQTSISTRTFPRFESLLNFLNDKIPVVSGISHIFEWPTCQEIHKIDDFVNGGTYVVTNSRRINKTIQYGKDETGWSTKKPSAGKIRHGEQSLYVEDGEYYEPLTYSSNKSKKQQMQPRVLTIVSNTNRDSQEKVILNPYTTQLFEQILGDIEKMLNVENPPITALFTAREPFRKVHGFSQLFHEYKTHSIFLACGTEQHPFRVDKGSGKAEHKNLNRDSRLTKNERGLIPLEHYKKTNTSKVGGGSRPNERKARRNNTPTKPAYSHEEQPQVYGKQPRHNQSRLVVKEVEVQTDDSLLSNESSIAQDLAHRDMWMQTSEALVWMGQVSKLPASKIPFENIAKNRSNYPDDMESGPHAGRISSSLSSLDVDSAPLTRDRRRRRKKIKLSDSGGKKLRDDLKNLSVDSDSDFKHDSKIPVVHKRSTSMRPDNNPFKKRPKPSATKEIGSEDLSLSLNIPHDSQRSRDRNHQRRSTDALPSTRSRSRSNSRRDKDNSPRDMLRYMNPGLKNKTGASSNASKTRAAKNDKKTSKKSDSESEFSRASRDFCVQANLFPSSPLHTSQGHHQDRPTPRNNLEAVQCEIDGKVRRYELPRYLPTDSDDTSAPSKELKMEWIYGYRGRDGRNNLYLLNSGELLYYVAAVAVMYDPRHHRQRHYVGHNEDIISMALHPEGRIVATGQMSGSSLESGAHVRVWDSMSLATYAVIGFGVFQISVSSISFSMESRGEYLLAVDEGEKHVLSIWNWKEDRLVAKTSTTDDIVVWANFHPDDDSSVISYGQQHIYFWKVFWEMAKPDMHGRILRDSKSGNLPSQIEMPRFVTTVAFDSRQNVLSGDSHGRIIVWTRDQTDAFVYSPTDSEPLKEAHQKTIFALVMLGDGTLISGGGNEVRMWDSNNGYIPIKSLEIPDGCGNVRTLISLYSRSSDCTLFVGTTRNLVLEGSPQTKFKILIQGHSDELSAIATDSVNSSFISAGYDQLLCKWDAESKELQWKSFVERPCSAAAFHPKGKIVVVGTVSGRIVSFNASNGAQLASVQISSSETFRVDLLAFSPDGVLLCICTHDGLIYIYECTDNGQVFRKYKDGVFKMQGKGISLIQVDWSLTGIYLQTVTERKDLLYWDVQTMSEEKSTSKMADVDWSTLTATVGFHAIGPWSNTGSSNKSDYISVLCRTPVLKNLQAVGDSSGRLSLYRWPSIYEKPQCTALKHYSGPVKAISFTEDGTRLITSGGLEAGLMQWQLVSV